MRILQIAPLWETVPPPAYGGIEAVVHLLIEKLVRCGHEVTLCASGDSRTSARLRSCYPDSLRTQDHLENKLPYCWQHAVFSMRQARHYDIVHNHVGDEVMALAQMVPDVPMLTTMHGVIPPDSRFIWDEYSGYYNAISWSQRRRMPHVRGGHFVGVAYNGIDVASFPFQAEKEDFVLFLGRLAPEKGPQFAVEAARRAGWRLVMAGKVDPVDRQFFADVVEPLIDGDRVVYLGEADGRMKRDLYRRAHCLLMPITWDEPFGLVLAEAMACGTPAIVFNRGAAPELVEHGETGFLVADVDEMVRAVSQVRTIDPAYCRAHVQRRFDVSVMAGRYLEMYESILETGGIRQRIAVSSNGSGEAEKLSPAHVA